MFLTRDEADAFTAHALIECGQVTEGCQMLQIVSNDADLNAYDYIRLKRYGNKLYMHKRLLGRP